MKIFIIGGGNFGSALAKVLSKNNEILLYDINKSVVDDVNLNHKNQKYFPGVRFNNDVQATDDLSKAKDYPMIILVVPSQVLADVCKKLKPYYTGQLLISASKGLSKQGLVMTIGWFLGSFLYIFLGLGFFVHLALLVFSIMGLISVNKGEMKKLPIIGDLAEKINI